MAQLERLPADLRVLHVNTSDIGGGAERIARQLAAGCQTARYKAWLAVGRKQGDDPRTLPIPDGRLGAWSRVVGRLSASLAPLGRRIKPVRRTRRWLEQVAFPINYVDALRGREDFHYPGTRQLLAVPPEPPDLLHLHNLHGHYFDLRGLVDLSRRLPCVVTLHDEWLLTGHCSYAGACQRWLSGCGACPDLSIYPAVRRDATAENWRIKDGIYRNSRLFLAAPSRWLLDEAKRSVLSSAIVEARVIPNGIDLAMFRPLDRDVARRRLGLPEDRPVLLTAANMIRRNRFKDWPTLHRAMDIVARRCPERSVLFIALGDSGATEHLGPVEIRFVPFETNPATVALYSQAADLYLHAAKSENAGLTVLEALACATPVVATAVGGTPEQIHDLADPTTGETATGVLVPPGDSDAMASAIITLLGNRVLRARLGERARADAEARFGEERMVQDYLDYYDAALTSFAGAAGREPR